jgi:hypothetical protein
MVTKTLEKGKKTYQLAFLLIVDNEFLSIGIPRGNGGRVVLQVRDRRHLSHGEIVLVTSDDDILSYKV